jgi:hypothetical protein
MPSLPFKLTRSHEIRELVRGIRIQLTEAFIIGVSLGAVVRHRRLTVLLGSVSCQSAGRVFTPESEATA